MSGSGKLVIRKVDTPRQALAELVMAWARDSATGEPRYIHELDAEHRGAKCGCVCLSCGEPLTAVNAAKAEFVRRPHFRHPEGAEKDACLVLSARAAALRQLHADGWIELPRRRMSATVAGLSGTFYEAWAELPPVKLHIRNVNYQDPIAAVVTLDDGRQVRVQLTGTPGEAGGALDANGLPVPTIFLDIDDPALAAMQPDEVRKRLTLLPEVLRWCSHPGDTELLAQAAAQAKARALLFLDEVPPELVLPLDMEPSLRRETVLHFVAKQILAEEQRVAVPALVLWCTAETVGGDILSRRWSAQDEVLHLECIALETRVGALVPDLTCRAWSNESGAQYQPLLIEVTVTNHIDDARLARIRELQQAALEIDLSRTGGRMTRDELRRLVVEEVAIKRWLYNPVLEAQREALSAELESQVRERDAEHAERDRLAAEHEARVMATPVGDIARNYLEAVTAMLEASADTDNDGRQRPEAVEAQATARAQVLDAAERLRIHGYPGAADEDLLDDHGILARILTCRLGRPVGFRQPNVIGVLNALLQMKGRGREWLTLYLIATRAYPPALTDSQSTWFAGKVEVVREAVRRGDDAYLRPTTYDKLLALMFPEMAEGLAYEKAKRQSPPSRSLGASNARIAAGQGKQSARGPLRSGPPGQRPCQGEDVLWLSGEALDEWIAKNPESAEAWFRGANGR